MTGVRPGAALLCGSAAAAVLAVAAALVDADLWRACAVVALLGLAGYAVLTGRGGLLGAGVALTMVSAPAGSADDDALRLLAGWVATHHDGVALTPPPA